MSQEQSTDSAEREKIEHARIDAEAGVLAEKYHESIVEILGHGYGRKTSREEDERLDSEYAEAIELAANNPAFYEKVIELLDSAWFDDWTSVDQDAAIHTHAPYRFANTVVEALRKQIENTKEE